LNKDLKTERGEITADGENKRRKSSERVMRLGLEILEH